MATPTETVPMPRTVLLFLTADAEGNLLMQTAGGSPRIVSMAKAHEQLVAFVRDPLNPAATMESSGFSVGDMMKGAAKFLADFNKGDGGG